MSQTLHVTAARLGETPVSGRIATIDAESASLRFEGEETPTFSCGELVRLDFVHAESSQPLCIHSVVRSRSEVAPAPVIDFEFLDWMSVREQLPPDLLPVFSNRRNPRVPGPQTDLSVLLVTVPGRNKIPGALKDISSDGLGVWLDPAFETAVHLNQSVTVQFRLPTYPYDLLLGAVIRHCQEADGRLIVGLAFDPDNTVEYTEQQNIITHYIQQTAVPPSPDC